MNTSTARRIRLYHLNYQGIHIKHLSLLFHAQYICEQSNSVCYCFILCNQYEDKSDYQIEHLMRLNCELNYLGLDKIIPVWKPINGTITNTLTILDNEYSIDCVLGKDIPHRDMVIDDISKLSSSIKYSDDVSLDSKLRYLHSNYVLSYRDRGITSDQLHKFINWNSESRSVNCLVPSHKMIPTVTGVINPILVKIVNWTPKSMKGIKVVFSSYFQPMSETFYLNRDHLARVKYDSRIYLKGIDSFYFVINDKNSVAKCLTAKIVQIDHPVLVKKTLPWISQPHHDVRFVVMPSMNIFEGKISSTDHIKFKIPDIGVCTNVTGVTGATPNTYTYTKLYAVSPFDSANTN